MDNAKFILVRENPSIGFNQYTIYEQALFEGEIKRKVVQTFYDLEPALKGLAFLCDAPIVIAGGGDINDNTFRMC